MTNQFGETLHISLKAHIIFAFYIGGESICLHLIGGESIKGHDTYRLHYCIESEGKL